MGFVSAVGTFDVSLTHMTSKDVHVHVSSGIDIFLCQTLKLG